MKRAVLDTLIPSIQPAGMLFPIEAYEEVYGKGDFTIAEIPDFQSLLPKAHAAGVPVFALSNEQIGETGPVLEQMASKRDSFRVLFERVVQTVVRLMDHAYSYHRFQTGIRAVRELEGLYDYLKQLYEFPQVSTTFFVPDCYCGGRSRQLIHDLVRVGMLQTFQGRRLPTPRYRTETISLGLYHNIAFGASSPT